MVTKNSQQSGVLMHISSLPSEFGIGTLGREAFAFVDFLVECGENFWQVLPLGVTGYGNSPYQCMSAYAGNLNFIDLETLINENLLSRKEVENIDWGNDKSQVDYSKIYENRLAVLKSAVQKFSVDEPKYIEFCEKNAFWLDDFSIFMALKENYHMQSFDNWDAEFTKRVKTALSEFALKNKAQIEFYKITQFWFYEQYIALKFYANQNGIKIIGDMPFYVAYDSADVWANPELFELDKNLLPKNVAGVPPDAFSDSGQLWGNPIYNYEAMRKNNYKWWSERIAHSFTLCDSLRIDHFRAFDSYYAIPFPSDDAKNGEWRKGEGLEFFTKLDLIDKDIIAEDLGDINDSVRQLIKDVGYPNMKVLQFAFDSNKHNEFIVKNHDENCVVYTGTHDNNTTKGWYKKASLKQKLNLFRFAPYSLFMKKSFALIKYAFSSKSKLIVIPMQDYLNLGECARMNLPSTLHHNWEWRISKEQMNQKTIDKIKKLKSKARK